MLAGLQRLNVSRLIAFFAVSIMDASHGSLLSSCSHGLRPETRVRASS